jgi:hypothetical protein
MQTMTVSDELVVHVLVGSLLFAVVFAPAVSSTLPFSGLQQMAKITENLAKLLTWTKYAIGGIDAVLYVLFMVKMCWIFRRKTLWKHAMKSSRPFWEVTTKAAAFAAKEYFWPFRTLASFVVEVFRPRRLDRAAPCDRPAPGPSNNV